MNLTVSQVGLLLSVVSFVLALIGLCVLVYWLLRVNYERVVAMERALGDERAESQKVRAQAERRIREVQEQVAVRQRELEARVHELEAQLDKWEQHPIPTR